MRRVATLTLFALLTLIPAAADAGPLQRFRDRQAQRKATPAPQAQPKAAAPKVMQAGPEPKVVEGPIRDRAKVALLRLLAVQHAVEHGVPNGDGTVRKVTRAEARKLADKVTDDQILKGMKVYGAPAEGRLEDLFDWILEHREEIAELVKWIVSLFALFSSESE
jgi:hypothetical protein